MVIFFLSLASFIASGVLFRHRSVLTFIAAAGALMQMHWMYMTMLHRTIFINVREPIFYTVAAIAAFVLWSLFVKQFNNVCLSHVVLWRDFHIFLVLLPVLASAVLVMSRNGYVQGEWIGHGFYNGDTATFSALVNRFIVSNVLAVDNPFAANEPLEYPTLAHASAASYIRIFAWNDVWLRYLPLFVIVQIIVTVPLLFLIVDSYQRHFLHSHSQVTSPTTSSHHMWNTVFVLYVLALSWDTYVYPQSHFFIMSLFFLLISLLYVNESRLGNNQTVGIAVALVVSLLLLCSNSVTGSAAIFMMALFAAMRIVNKSRHTFERNVFAAIFLGVLVAFFYKTPGDAALSWFHFSYTASLDMLRLALPLSVLVALLLRSKTTSFIHWAVLVLIGMSLTTFFLSSRDIVVENASRFTYHAILVGFPVIALAVHESLRRWGSVVKSGFVVSLTLFFLMPTLASVVSAHDHLLYKDTHVLGADELEALHWIRRNTSPESIFLADPDGYFDIPMFTGRSMVRSDYWLSPKDDLFHAVRRAFQGDEHAQELVRSRADYLYIRDTEHTVWGGAVGDMVFVNSAATIYKLPARSAL